jgi:ectoine hydroxylase-related dioxygenase (phytanoyl-CoA dioxygenase family)
MHKLNTNEMDFFQNNGFLILRKFLPDDDLYLFSEALRKIIQIEIEKCEISVRNKAYLNYGQEFGCGMQFLELNDHKHVANINDILYGMPEIHRLTSNPRISEVITKLLYKDLRLDCRPLFCQNATAVLAAPYDDKHTHRWHKDTFYTLPDSNFLQIWAPLIQDSTVELGTLKICPGSHKNGYKGQIYEENERYIFRYRVTDDELLKYEQLDICLNLGDLIIFHPGLIHSGGHNTSNTTRFSLVATYHQVDFPLFSPKPIKKPLDYYNELYGTNYKN